MWSLSSFKFKIICILLFNLNYFCDSIHITEFDDFCVAEKLYKPYLHIYNGRKDGVEKGKPNITHGPGLHSDISQNSYICINGLVWLYFGEITLGVSIFHKPELHMYTHHCQFYDGIEGPGAFRARAKMLLAVLLMGDPTDYRKPNIQLLVAPFNRTIKEANGTDPSVIKHINATSLLMFGDETECILKKDKMHIRIRTETINNETFKNWEAPGYAGTFCKLSYQFMDTNTKEGPPVKPTPNFPHPNHKIEGEDALEQDKPIKTIGCWAPDNYTLHTTQVVKNRTANHTSFIGNDTHTTLIPEKFYYSASAIKYFEILKADLTTKDWKDGGDPPNIKADEFVPATDLCVVDTTLPDGCSETDHSLPKCLNKCSEEGIKLQIENAVKAGKPEELKEKSMKIHLAPCRDAAFKRWTELDAAFQKITEMWKWNVTGLGQKFAEHNDKIAKGIQALAAARRSHDKVKIKEAEDHLHEAQRELRDNKELPPMVSRGESLQRDLNLMLDPTKQSFENLVAQYEVGKNGGTPKCMWQNQTHFNAPAIGGKNIFINRGNSDTEFLKPMSVDGDPTFFPSDADAAKNKRCGELPNLKKTCSGSKPSAERACQIYNSKKGIYVDGGSVVRWKDEDKWRQEVLSLIQDIYTYAVSPVIKDASYVSTSANIVKGYLLDYIKGSLVTPTPPPPETTPTNPNSTTTTTAKPGPAPPPPPPPPAARRRKREDAAPATTAAPTPAPSSPPPNGTTKASIKSKASNDPLTPPLALPSKRKFWDVIVRVLKDCKMRDNRLYFKYSGKNQQELVYLARHIGEVEERRVWTFIEQADHEFAFNYAIDNFWRMFTTVMGVCMPAYEDKIPLITTKFYSHFTEDFMFPLAREWVKNRDNRAIRHLIGEYREKGLFWSKACLEAGFVHSGDANWRPPRILLVNHLTEMNFFTQGPVMDTKGWFLGYNWKLWGHHNV